MGLVGLLLCYFCGARGDAIFYQPRPIEFFVDFCSVLLKSGALDGGSGDFST